MLMSDRLCCVLSMSSQLFFFSRHLLGASAMDLCDSLSPRAVQLERARGPSSVLNQRQQVLDL